MTDCYSFHAGSSPLLISVPHDGRQLPDDIVDLMSDAGKSLPDTDWHVTRLYEFAHELGASLISANYSRYVVDLNRPADDAAMYEGQLSTGLCPVRTFDGESIYATKVSIDTQSRVARYWRPYHDKIQATLNAKTESHGHALLWDAHSIASQVPTLFDGELPVLNMGTWDGRSCAPLISDRLMAIASNSDYEAVINARFKGGHITRHYGQPDNGVHAVQMELAQRSYMNEKTTAYDKAKASRVRDTLKMLLESFMETAER